MSKNPNKMSAAEEENREEQKMETQEEESPADANASSDVPVKGPEEEKPKEEEQKKEEEEPPAKKQKTEGEDDKDEKKRPPELEKFWKAVTDDPADFTGWTYLLQYVDTNGEPDQADEAYDAFLHRYPYCYGYWKKYADYQKRKRPEDKQRCLDVFERGMSAVPLSVDLWIHYLAHVKGEFAQDRPDFVRDQYERALRACGREWRSDKLWDSYVQWEATDRKDLPAALAVYDRVIRNPTQGLAHQFEKFKDFVKEHNPKDLLDVNDFLALRKEVLESLSKDKGGDKDDKDKEKEDEGGAPGEDDSRVTTDEENQALREKIIFSRKKVFKETEDGAAYRWKFEDQIKRPYFHMKPLERGQLKNWAEYLNHEAERQAKEEGGGDEEGVEVLFERCLIACALYEEFWNKYAKWLTTKAKRGTEEERAEKARGVFRRAVTHHLPGKVDIHLRFAAFEEERGNFDRAAEILEGISSRQPSLLSLMLRRVNLERRRGNVSEVHRLYRECIAREGLAAGTKSDLSIKYSRFLRLVLDDSARALETVESALGSDDANPKLYMQQLDILVHQFPMDADRILSLLDRALDKMESVKHRLLFSQRKVEFLEDFGTSIAALTSAQEAHSKLTAEIRAQAAKSGSSSSGDAAAANGEVGSGIKTIEGRAKKPAANGAASAAAAATTTYAAAAANSASYGAHHTSQYQQYGARYSQYPSSAQGYYGGYSGGSGY